MLVVVATVVVDGVVLWRHVDRLDVRPTGSPGGGTTFLLVGSDSRAFVTNEADRARYGSTSSEPGNHADVVLALRLRDDGSATMLRISRDLLVLAPSGAPTRLAHALAGGPQEVVDTLCHSLGIGVDHFVEVHLDGLRAIVNSIGGIDVVADGPVRDLESGLRLNPGRNHLDGDQTNAYIGARHVETKRNGRWVPDDTADLVRSDRAAEILTLIGERLDLSPWHPLTSQRRLWAATGAVSTDGSLGPFDALDLRRALSQLAKMPQVSLPMRSEPGEVPVDILLPGAGKVLAEFDGPKPAKGCTATLGEAVR